MMRGISKNAEMLVKKYSENMMALTFSNPLGTLEAELLSACRLESRTSYKFRVPPRICKSCSNMPGQATRLPVSAALAVFDDLSTSGFMLLDKNCRPGVSISLNMEMLQPVQADDQLILHIDYDKIGASIGFCTATMINSKQQVVAKGKHMKFLNMGVVWNTLTHPYLLPLVVQAMQIPILNSAISKLMASKAQKKVSDGCSKELGGIYTYLQQKHVSVGTAEMKVSPELCNIMGLMHGGAVAMSCEETVAASMGSEAEKINAMEVTYMSALGGNISIHVEQDAWRLNRISGYANKAKGSSSNQQVAVQFRCETF